MYMYIYIYIYSNMYAYIERRIYTLGSHSSLITSQDYHVYIWTEDQTHEWARTPR